MTAPQRDNDLDGREREQHRTHEINAGMAPPVFAVVGDEAGLPQRVRVGFDHILELLVVAHLVQALRYRERAQHGELERVVDRRERILAAGRMEIRFAGTETILRWCSEKTTVVSVCR